MNVTKVLFIDEVAERLRMSTRTIRRKLDAKTFPIKPLKPVDSRTRWSEADVEAYVSGQTRRTA